MSRQAQLLLRAFSIGILVGAIVCAAIPVWKLSAMYFGISTLLHKIAKIGAEIRP